jgi:hypothetical protein
VLCLTAILRTCARAGGRVKGRLAPSPPRHRIILFNLATDNAAVVCACVMMIPIHCARQTVIIAFDVTDIY